MERTFVPVAGQPPREDVRPAVFPLERGKVYEGGNLHDLERALGVTGDQVLYVGDHIYGDILRSKKESAWRTAMVIQELETEVLAYESCRADLARSEDLEDLHERLEDELRYYQARFKDLTRQIAHAKAKPNGVPLADLDGERGRTKRAGERLRGRPSSLAEFRLRLSGVARTGRCLRRPVALSVRAGGGRYQPAPRMILAS